MVAIWQFFALRSTGLNPTMSITVHEFDGISCQFRIKPHEMPTMSTPTTTPNYATIRAFALALRKNTLAIPSYQTHLGNLALVISPEVFLEVKDNRPFVAPAKPGLADVNRTNTCALVESSRQFTFQQHEYMKFQATNQAIRNLILNATDDKYIKTLKHKITSYANISPIIGKPTER